MKLLSVETDQNTFHWKIVTMYNMPISEQLWVAAKPNILLAILVLQAAHPPWEIHFWVLASEEVKYLS